MKSGLFGIERGIFRHFIEEAQGQAGSVYGRQMYEVMRYWDEDHPEWDAYEAVDPDNRLVAASLERGWEEKLLALRQAEEEAEHCQQRPPFPQLSPELRQQLEQMGPALPTLWASGKISNGHKKRLLRCLISRVIATCLVTPSCGHQLVPSCNGSWPPNETCACPRNWPSWTNMPVSSWMILAMCSTIATKWRCSLRSFPSAMNANRC